MNGEVNSSTSEHSETQGSKRKVFDQEDHPDHPKAEQPHVGKNPDGTWGPTGLYGGRVKESKLVSILRAVVKPSRLKRVEEVLQMRCRRVQCLFENLSDPANGAACLRTMEGFGLLDAHAVEAYEPFRVHGGITMHAEKWMRMHRYHHCMDAATALKEQGFTMIATCLDDDAVEISTVDFSAMEKICVMFGNEERGLSWALRDAADIKVYIPMVGFSQSFNISVSCAMTLYHLRDRGVLSADLSDEELTELYQRWLLMSTKKASGIVKKHDLGQSALDYM